MLATNPCLRIPCVRRDHGVTLAELLVVIAMLGLLLTASLPGLAGQLAAARLPLAARTLAAHLGLARTNAVLRNSRATVTFTENGYVVRYESGTPATTAATLLPGIHVQRTPVSGVVRFHPSGIAENGTVILVGASGDTRAVVVNQRGRITVQ